MTMTSPTHMSPSSSAILLSDSAAKQAEPTKFQTAGLIHFQTPAGDESSVADFGLVMD